MEKVSRPNSIVWRSYAENKISKLISNWFQLNWFQGVSRSYDQNDKSDHYETWNPTIIHYYGSDETGFVEIRVRDQNGYFYIN